MSALVSAPGEGNRNRFLAHREILPFSRRASEQLSVEEGGKKAEKGVAFRIDY